MKRQRTTTSLLGSLLCLLAATALVSTASAGDPWTQRLVPTNPAHGTSFGETIALGGDTMAVGAPDALGSGVVVIFRRDPTGWSEEAVLVPPTPSIGARFGAALRFEGTELLIGAPDASDGGLDRQGEVVAFERSPTGNWSHSWTLYAPNPVIGGQFGSAFASNVWMWIGEPGNGDGFAWGYLRGWTPGNTPVLDQGLSEGGPGARFGASLARGVMSWAVSLDRELFVGAPGARRVFVAYEWHDAVSVGGSVSAPALPEFGKAIGSASGLGGGVFERLAVASDATGVEVYDDHDFGDFDLHHTTVQSFDGGGAGGFGDAFAIWNGGMIVGDPTAALGNLPDSGGAYRYAFDQGLVHDLGGLSPRPAAAGEGAGASVAINGTIVALGAPSAGAVHLFDVAGLLGTPHCSSVPNAAGAQPVLYGYGSDQVADRSFQVVAAGLPPHTLLTLGASQNATETPFGYGCAGLRCLAPPFVRFVNDIVLSDGAGGTTIDMDPLALPMGAVIAPGDTWNFQVWYRDRQATTSSNTTHALQVTFR